jgi:pimeloyl-ACP methyl ester carboxylesterase
LLDDDVVEIQSLVDEIDDRTASTIDLARLSSFGGPLMMSRGTESPSFFDAILDIIADAVPRAQRYTFRGAGHVPHVTHPDDYAMVIGAYISGVADAAIADR